MKKEELVYREIASKYLDGKNSFTQKGLAEELSVSLGGVNKTVSKLVSINAVSVSKMSFSVVAFDRLMLYWATHRKLGREIAYEGRGDAAVNEIESSMPGGVAFTAYTAYKKLYKNTPADYSEVYVYATGEALAAIKGRFREGSKYPNLFVLRADAILEAAIKGRRLTSGSVPVPQVFVDLWNIRSWYAKEFSDAMSKRIFGR